MEDLFGRIFLKDFLEGFFKRIFLKDFSEGFFWKVFLVGSFCRIFRGDFQSEGSFFEGSIARFYQRISSRRILSVFKGSFQGSLKGYVEKISVRIFLKQGRYCEGFFQGSWDIIL